MKGNYNHGVTFPDFNPPYHTFEISVLVTARCKVQYDKYYMDFSCFESDLTATESEQQNKRNE